MQLPSDQALEHLTSPERPRHPELLDLVARILNGAAGLAATTANDARTLALRLHDERQDDAMLALGIALDLQQIATETHAAAEQAASVADIWVGGA